MHGDELTLEHVKRLHTLALEAWGNHVSTCKECRPEHDCAVMQQIDATIDKWEHRMEDLEWKAERDVMVKRIMRKADEEGWFSGSKESE